MIQSVFARRRSALRVTSLLLAASLLALVPAVVASPARAQALGYASAQSGAFPEDQIANDPAAQDEDSALPERFRRTIVSFDTREAPGTVIIDTGNTYLYYVLGGGRAMRYGVGVGRQGFTWSGVQTVSRKAEWPDWYPPAEMIARQPYLPRFVAGGRTPNAPNRLEKKSPACAGASGAATHRASATPAANCMLGLRMEPPPLDSFS